VPKSFQTPTSSSQLININRFLYTTITTARPPTAAVERPGSLSTSTITALKRHITKAEGATRMEMGVGSGMEGANERCAPHTPLHSGFFMPPIVWGRFFPAEGSVNHAAPIFFCFERGRCACHTSPPFSFHFEWGRHMSPHFFFVSNGGGVCRPMSFLFERGRCACHTSPPFLFVSNGGGVHATRRPLFLSILNGGSVNPTRCLHFFFFSNGGRHESLPPFLSI